MSKHSELIVNLDTNILLFLKSYFDNELFLDQFLEQLLFHIKLYSTDENQCYGSHTHNIIIDHILGRVNMGGGRGRPLSLPPLTYPSHPWSPSSLLSSKSCVFFA